MSIPLLHLLGNINIFRTPNQILHQRNRIFPIDFYPPCQIKSTLFKIIILIESFPLKNNHIPAPPKSRTSARKVILQTTNLWPNARVRIQTSKLANTSPASTYCIPRIEATLTTPRKLDYNKKNRCRQSLSLNFVKYG